MIQKLKSLSIEKKILISSGLICLFIVIAIGVSYAVWQLNLAQDTPNVVTSACFSVEFSELSDAIALKNAYPMTDQDGKNLTPYEFKVTNNCQSYVKYQVNLEILNTSTLSSEYLKVMQNSSEPVLMNTLVSTTPRNTLASSAYIFDTGYLNYDEEKTFSLRVWLDENVTTSTPNIQNTKWSAKITIEGSYADSLPENVTLE